MPNVRNPGGVIHYGGAAVFTMRSADGWVYTVYVGERPGRKFGTHCYRTAPDNTRSEWVELPEFTEGRVGVTVEADGVYLSWPINRDRDVTRVKLPGFILPGYPSSGQSSPAPTNPIPTQPVPTQPVDVVDEGARQYTTAVKKELIAELDRLKARVAALEQKPSGGGVTEQQVRDIAWQLAADRIYAELNGYNNPIKNVLETIIRRIIKSG